MIQELGNNLVPVLGVVGTFLFLIIWVIAATIDSIYKTSCNARLKERLIERGATPSEIDQIITAGASKEEIESMHPSPHSAPHVGPRSATTHPGKAFSA